MNTLAAVEDHLSEAFAALDAMVREARENGEVVSWQIKAAHTRLALVLHDVDTVLSENEQVAEAVA